MSARIFADLPRISAALLHEPWLIIPGHHQSMVEQLEAHRTGQPKAFFDEDDEEDANPEDQEGYVNRITTFDKRSGLAIMDVRGVIGKGLSNLAMMCGGFDLNSLHDGLERLSDLKPKAVQLYLNTPGGTVTGVEEAAASLEEFAGTVAPVHAYVDILCASAGEWVGSAATTRHAAGSATLGSIGVYCALIDSSEYYQKRGLKVNLVASGPDKGAGYPGTEISEDHIAKVREDVRQLSEEFFAQMSRRQAVMGRPALEKDVHFTGATFRAKTPEGRALIDGIIPSRSQHLQALVSQYGRKRS